MLQHSKKCNVTSQAVTSIGMTKKISLQHSKSSVATSKKIIATQRDLTQEIAGTIVTTASLRSRGGRGGGGRGGRGLRSRGGEGGGGGLRSRSRGGG
jgi:hypothetical protein